MYPERQSNRTGKDDYYRDHESHRQLPAQYAPAIGVAEWNPSYYYGTVEYGDESVSNFPPVGSNLQDDVPWMDTYNGPPNEIGEQATNTNLSPPQIYASGIQRTASAPTAIQETQRPFLRSQTPMPDPEDLSASSSRRSSVIPEGQPGPSEATASSTRRTPSARYSSRPRLEEENRLLLDLRDRQHLPWRQITRHFEQTYGREYRMPTLQMRHGRLSKANQANRQRQWTDADTEALHQAWKWYMDERWRIIADRMQQFGATETWTPEECEMMWRRFNGNEDMGDDDTGNS